MTRSFSQSALSTAYRCGKLFQYLYVDKLKSDQPSSADMKFGTAIHLGLETLLSGEGDYLNDFKLFWELEKGKENQYGRFKHEELTAQGITLLERFKRLHSKKIRVFQAEKRLYGNIKDIKVEGTPDLLGYYNGIPSIIDFKTSGTKYDKDKAQISEQMFLYAYLAHNELFYPEQLVYIVFVKGNEPSIQTIAYRFTQKEMDQAIHNVYLQCQDLLHKEDKNIFTQNKNSCIIGSRKCDFYERCHGGKK